MARTARRVLAGVAGLAMIAWAAGAAAGDAEDILIVYHPGGSVAFHSPEEAREAFLGEVRGVKPGVYLDNDPNQARFVGAVLGMSVAAYDTYWTEKIVHEGRPAPKRLRSTRAMLEYVAGTPGAVGYVPRAESAAVAAYGERLKVLPWSPGPAAGR